MTLRFEPNLDFQLQAVNAVCDLFRGQEECSTEFTVTRHLSDRQQRLAFGDHDLGVGNRLKLLNDEILVNLREIQLRNGLPPSESLSSGDFTVEMETGTGKTYVYLRTILELNKRYGFTKFVIVVPSVAIKEGVYKSLQMTHDHFRTLYSGTPFAYFLYDSAKLGKVRTFATSPVVQIMVVTVGAINKQAVNNLYKHSEKTGGEKPIDLIRATRPILIVDEPQSVDGGLRGRGREALRKMRPLCTLRYSATHVDRHHMVYRLDAVDAYERKLVKQIEVASATVEDAHNRPYVRLISTTSKRGDISATVELDVEYRRRVRRVRRVVRHGDDLEQTTGRAVYRDCRVGEIGIGRGRSFVELRVPHDEVVLRLGQAWGDVEPPVVARHMIRRTIREHLDKEKRLRPQGIKVLSLFFIDAVERYRRYDDAGNAIKGDYAVMFEREYRRLSQHSDYQSLFGEVDFRASAEEVHDGYFSIDRRGGWTETAENNQTNRENAERAYNLIMREKEKLLSLDEPLKFIFSHSALREGWDNPNVFQICALRNIQTELERRQTIGRGLRLCVNQSGERIRGFEINTLTVVARESYEDFAENLQHEIEKETGFKFGVIEPHHFAQVFQNDDSGGSTTRGFSFSQAIFDHLQTKGYIDKRGRIRDSLREALHHDAVELPEEFTAQRKGIVAVLRKRSGRLEIRNADKRHTVRPRQKVLNSDDFKALWDRIKHKTTYRVNFDNEALLKQSAVALQKSEAIPRTRLQWRKADISIGQAGVETREISGSRTIVLDDPDIELPDLLTELQDRTQLTRRSICRILVSSDRLDDFRLNPQRFIDVAAKVINGCKQRALVDGIKYEKIGGAAYFSQQLFQQNELTGYLKNMLGVKKSVYDKIIYESGTESRFADGLEKNTGVKVYAKLPGWFKVPTPLGSYNPDWAVVVDTDEGERLYFVVETKGSILANELRVVEDGKIACGRAHFHALNDRQRPAQYTVATTIDQFLATMVVD